MSFPIFQEQDYGGMLGRAIGESLGGGLQSGLVNQFQQQQQQQNQQREMSALQQAMSHGGQDPQSQLNAVLRAPISNETKKLAIQSIQNQQEMNQRGQFQQQKFQQRESETQQKNLQEEQKNLQNLSQKKEVKDSLLKRGVPEDIADLYSNATGGGKTAILKNLLDLEQRGMLPQGVFEQVSEQNEMDQDISDISQPKEKGFKFPKLEKPKARTPREQAQLQNQREKTNTPFYQDIVGKVKGSENQGLSLKRLEQLNNSGKLPTGFEKWNINWVTGEPRFGAAQLSPETQLFVKTVNDFTTKAKDSYGSRVTNFDLQQFMKRLPTLANSTEGRGLILKQMEILNEIDELDHKTLQEVYDHYGIDNINSQQAKKIANVYKKEAQKDLLERYKSLDNLLDDVPTRKKVAEGTKINPKIALKYFEMSSGDEEQAKLMAKEDGYEF